jgi:ABC-type cobalamin/Fe3+-siderophores transport system ATPase subunit
MRRIDLELKNYRCFPDSRPARFTLEEGFVSFVGINNAGKSSLLKFFYEFRDLFTVLSSLNSSWLSLVQGNRHTVNLLGTTDPLEVFNDANPRGIQLKIEVRDDEGVRGALPEAMLIDIDRSLGCQMTIVMPGGDLRRDGIAGIDEALISFTSEIGPVDASPFVRAFHALATSLYVGPFRNAINVGTNTTYYDLSIGEAFISSWRQFKTGPTKSNRVAAADVTSAIQRIFEFEDLEINASEDGQTLAIDIDGRPYRLHELGAGLSHFIIVLAFVATRKPPFVFIDEPESNLHPALQLDFLTTLASFTDIGVVFATHSLGLARSGSQRIYSVRRIGQGESDLAEYEKTAGLAEFLGELSFSGYQDLGFDRVLLVEGPTDVTTFQRFLRRFGVEHRLVLLPLGGASIINTAAAQQLAEIKRITPNLNAIIDSERNAAGEALSPDRSAFAEICAELEIPCHVLERRALENYLDDRAVKAVKGDSYRALAEYERRQDVSPVWGKAENWRIAGEMTEDEIRNAGDLGPFIVDLAASVSPAPNAT